MIFKELFFSKEKQLFSCNCFRFVGILSAEGSIMTQKQYGRLVKEMSPKSPIWRDCLLSFLIGGGICLLGQVFMNFYTGIELSKEDAATATSMSLVAISALLTGLSLYDDIAKYAGAGTLVPITGFANSIAAPAVEFKTGRGRQDVHHRRPCDCVRSLRRGALRPDLLDHHNFIKSAARERFLRR